MVWTIQNDIDADPFNSNVNQEGKVSACGHNVTIKIICGHNGTADTIGRNKRVPCPVLCVHTVDDIGTVLKNLI